MSGAATGDPEDAIEVRRDLTARDGGVLATYTLTVADGEPITADVVDDLPSRCDHVSEIGVHPEFEPGESAVGEDRIVFRVAADPGEERVVKYGISADEPIDDATLGIWEAETRPHARVVDPDTPLTRGGADAVSSSGDGFASAAESSPGGEDHSEADPASVGDGGPDDGPAPEVDLDLESGEDAILDDLTEDGAEPEDFVARVAGDTDDSPADALSDPGTSGTLNFDAGVEGDGDDAPTADDTIPDVEGDAARAVRIDSFRSRLTALAGSSLALHAVEDDDAAAALLDGLADELEAVDAEFEALRAAFDEE